MRLLQIGICLVIALALSACATNTKKISKSTDPAISVTPLTTEELARWKTSYDQLKVQDETGLEMGLLGLPRNQERESMEILLAKQFPWLKPRHLSEKDRLFLLRVGNNGRPMETQVLLMPAFPNRQKKY